MDSRAVMMRQRTMVLVEVMEVPVTWIGDQSSTRAELLHRPSFGRFGASRKGMQRRRVMCPSRVT